MVARGVCIAKGGHAWDMTRYGKTINERAVRILLEYILVSTYFHLEIIIKTCRTNTNSRKQPETS